MEAIIKLENAVIRQQKNTILKDVSLEIKEGEFVYLIGKVGSGKTSLLKTLYAELPLIYGKGEVAGYQLSKIKKSQIAYLRRKCGIVFQDFKLLTDRNVYANLEFVLKATGWKDKKAIKERINEVLDKVELPDKRDKFPHQLSGGEQQRIVLARALLNAPPIILADEPTGNIDPETSYRLVELLKDICDSGKTVVIATHQYDLIKHFPGKVFRCENGVLQEDFSFAENQAAMTTIISENSVIDIESLTKEIEEPTVVHEVISLNEDPEILSPTEPTLQEMQEITLVTEDSEITDSTTILIEEKMTEEPQDTSEENISSENDKTKKKDDNDPDFVGFELI
ncbi:ATP-binding cassette domain-containing protein [Butyricimonas virosa]|uniref:ATP-binding cassette domain-containing protein n=2 Tax=Butyricimonas virosa TaxID=544645 RepID=A0A412WUM3_9BACT|nr:ATP-binding cassette domain-containing protein [Porphyromonadaceae bacterium]RGL90549.1 ATP-binding cassette domain-containing protein [Butyricimonas virosa]HAM82806.1 peptide transporter [Butyricimonas sp.]RGV30934.1 ATP-binding cassette domain-containing protein [Butyricimonas virosa]RHI21037.1 ATP-binding cassette domain-containing protein [Butyricimonas virosa]